MLEFEIEKFRQKKKHKNTIVRMRYSPTGQFLISADKSGELIIWSAQNQNIIKRFQSSQIPLSDVWFSEDEKMLFVGHQGGLLSIYSLPQIKLIAELELKQKLSNTPPILSGTSRPILDNVVMVACAVDSPNIFVALEYREFFCIDKNDFKIVDQSDNSGNIIEQTALTSNCKIIFFGDNLGYIYRFEPNEMKMILFAEHHEVVSAFDSAMRPTVMDTSTGVAALALSSDGRWLASTSYSGGVQIWDTEKNISNYDDIRKFSPSAAKKPRQKGRMRGVSFYPNSSNVIIGGDDGVVEIWDFNKLEVIYSANCQEGIRSLDVSLKDSMCAVGCKEGTVFLIPLPGNNNPTQKSKSSWFKKLINR